MDRLSILTHLAALLLGVVVTIPVVLATCVATEPLTEGAHELSPEQRALARFAEIYRDLRSNSGQESTAYHRGAATGP